MHKIQFPRSFTQTLTFENEYIVSRSHVELIADESRLVLQLPGGTVPISITSEEYRELRDAIHKEGDYDEGDSAGAAICDDGGGPPAGGDVPEQPA